MAKRVCCCASLSWVRLLLLEPDSSMEAAPFPMPHHPVINASAKAQVPPEYALASTGGAMICYHVTRLPLR